MNRWVCMFAAVFLCVLGVGCKKQANDQEAIRAAIDKHLNETMGLNMSAMDREVKQVSVDGDHGTAQVEFRLKEGDARMEIEYTMQRQGKDWTVLKSEPIGGGSSHPGSEGPASGGPPSN